MPLIEAALIKEKIPYASSAGFLCDRRDVKTPCFLVIKFLFNRDDGEYLDQKLLKAIRAELYTKKTRKSHCDVSSYQDLCVQRDALPFLSFTKTDASRSGRNIQIPSPVCRQA